MTQNDFIIVFQFFNSVNSSFKQFCPATTFPSLSLSRNLDPCLDAAPDVANFTTPQSVLAAATLAECDCDVGTQQCPAGAEGPEPPVVVMPSFDYLARICPELSSYKYRLNS